MESRNNVTYFVLLGLTQNPKEQKVLFVLLLLFYIFTLVGNLLIVVTITVSKTLNSLMYFFLACLSFIDLMYASSISPRVISDLYFGENTISFKLVWPSCLQSTFLVDQRSSFCWWWPVTAMWPSVSPCIIWWSWGRGCVLCCCCCHLFVVLCTQ